MKRLYEKDIVKDENYLKFSYESLGIIFCLSGIGIIISILFFQFIIINSLSNSKQITMSENQIFSLNNLALPIFIMYLIGLSIFIFGITLLVKSWVSTNYKSYNKNFIIKEYYNFRNISSFALRGNGQRIFSISLILYLITVLFLNNTIIYKENISFSSAYGVKIPSAIIIGCCGQPGEFPLISFYITDHFGLMLIPINLIISLFFSFLAGLNISLLYRIHKINKNSESCINNKYKNRKNIMSVIGIIPGLFVSCPTCAGNLLLLSLFGTSLISAEVTIAFTLYQSIFLFLGFILMFVFPFIASRNKFLFVNN